MRNSIKVPVFKTEIIGIEEVGGAWGQTVTRFSRCVYGGGGGGGGGGVYSPPQVL